jgi:ABC-type branched-subunit amino acid transport system ATPase component
LTITDSQPAIAEAPLLECRDITVRFGGLAAVDGISLNVHRGEVVGLIGPNGSGKSTFLNAVSGLVGADGKVSVSGVRLRLGRPGAIAAQRVFRTYQTPQVARELTSLENVLVASPNPRHRGILGAWALRPAMWTHDRQRWEKASAALDTVGLLEKANVLAGALSYGEQRYLEIARALCAEPELLLMDEPAAGLSSMETGQLAILLQGVAARGVSLLVIEHKIGFIESLCNRVVVLDVGRQIASGPPGEVWKEPAVIRAYLGEPR